MYHVCKGGKKVKGALFFTYEEARNYLRKLQRKVERGLSDTRVRIHPYVNFYGYSIKRLS